MVKYNSRRRSGSKSTSFQGGTANAFRAQYERVRGGRDGDDCHGYGRNGGYRSGAPYYEDFQKECNLPTYKVLEKGM